MLFRFCMKVVVLLLLLLWLETWVFALLNVPSTASVFVGVAAQLVLVIVAKICVEHWFGVAMKGKSNEKGNKPAGGDVPAV